MVLVPTAAVEAAEQAEHEMVVAEESSTNLSALLSGENSSELENEGGYVEKNLDEYVPDLAKPAGMVELEKLLSAWAVDFPSLGLMFSLRLPILIWYLTCSTGVLEGAPAVGLGRPGKTFSEQLSWLSDVSLRSVTTNGAWKTK